jgi:hypothetical protein
LTPRATGTRRDTLGSRRATTSSLQTHRRSNAWPVASGQSRSSRPETVAILGITSVYLQGIDNAEIIETVHARRAPMIAVNATLLR